METTWIYVEAEGKYVAFCYPENGELAKQVIDVEDAKYLIKELKKVVKKIEGKKNA